jgi:hypothetical protein
VMPFHHSSAENAGYPSGSGPVKRQGRRDTTDHPELVFLPSGR